MTDEYIRKAYAIDAVNHALDRETILFSFVRKVAISALKKMPSADVVPVVHGRWEHFYLPMSIMPHKCSICGCPAPCHMKGRDLEEYLTDYCPNCGAKMDGERKE